jgi:prolyl oligopeptidase
MNWTEGCTGGVMAIVVSMAAAAQPTYSPPATPSRPVVETVHGVTLTDAYRWLENGRDADVEKWTRAQHAATLAWLQANAPPVPGLRAELEQLIDRDVTRAPFFRKGREFFLRTRKGEQQAKLYTRLAGEERLLFDPTMLDPSGKTALGSIVLSRDGSKAAVAAYAKGSEYTDYRIIDTLTGKQLGPTITGVRGFSWARDERYAYISPRTAESDARQEPMKCYRHRLGGDRASDELLLAVDDAKDYCAVYEPLEGDVTVFENGNYYANTVRIRPLGASTPPRTIWTSSKHRAQITFRRDRFYVRSNEGAPNWKLMAGTYARPESRDWQLLVPEQETVLQDFDVTAQWLLLLDKKDVLTRLFAHDLDGNRVRELDLPVLDWKLVWQDDPPLDTSRIVAKRIFVPAKDGAKVPAFVLHRDDIVLDGTNPVLLYGYGGFEIGIGPFYVSTLGAFINRGGVFVDAGLRGGDEYGERWHEQGMLARKQTTFDDLFAVAEWLVTEKYTVPSKLAVQGGSNGGLLVGAAITQRPDLFGVALCQVPLLDMVRYHRFLIARAWIPEYGDPDKPDDFRTLLAYSPYHHLRQGVNLPLTMVTAGEYDSRVDPLHAKKFVAAAQNNAGQVAPVLLYMDFDSGHGLGKSRKSIIDDREYELRFLMNALGMNKAK